MPPPGIPAWLYPSVVLQEAGTQTYIWVQSCYCGTGNTEPQFEIRYVNNMTSLENDSNSVTIEVSRRVLVRSVGQILGGFIPLSIDGRVVYIDNPDYQQERPEPFTQRPLIGFRRIMSMGAQTEQWLPPAEGTDADLEVISSRSLMGSIGEGYIRLASPDRTSPLGGSAVVIQQNGLADTTTIDRSDIGLSPLRLNHDETRAIRVLPDDNGVQALPPVTWVQRAADALAARLPPEALAADLATMHGINVDDAYRIMTAERDRAALQPGAVLISRHDPSVMIGIVEQVFPINDLVRVVLSPDGFTGRTVVDVPIPGLLEDAIPSPNMVPSSPGIRGAANPIDVFEQTAHSLRSKGVPRPQPPTSFERILKDDEVG